MAIVHNHASRNHGAVVVTKIINHFWCSLFLLLGCLFWIFSALPMAAAAPVLVTGITSPTHAVAIDPATDTSLEVTNCDIGTFTLSVVGSAALSGFNVSIHQNTFTTFVFAHSLVLNSDSEFSIVECVLTSIDLNIHATSSRVMFHNNTVDPSNILWLPDSFLASSFEAMGNTLGQIAFRGLITGSNVTFIECTATRVYANVGLTASSVTLDRLNVTFNNTDHVGLHQGALNLYGTALDTVLTIRDTTVHGIDNVASDNSVILFGIWFTSCQVFMTGLTLVGECPLNIPACDGSNIYGIFFRFTWVDTYAELTHSSVRTFGNRGVGFWYRYFVGTNSTFRSSHVTYEAHSNNWIAVGYWANTLTNFSWISESNVWNRTGTVASVGTNIFMWTYNGGVFTDSAFVFKNTSVSYEIVVTTFNFAAFNAGTFTRWTLSFTDCNMHVYGGATSTAGILTFIAFEPALNVIDSRIEFIDSTISLEPATAAAAEVMHFRMYPIAFNETTFYSKNSTWHIGAFQGVVHSVNFFFLPWDTVVPVIAHSRFVFEDSVLKHDKPSSTSMLHRRYVVRTMNNVMFENVTFAFDSTNISLDCSPHDGRTHVAEFDLDSGTVGYARDLFFEFTNGSNVLLQPGAVSSSEGGIISTNLPMYGGGIVARDSNITQIIAPLVRIDEWHSGTFTFQRCNIYVERPSVVTNYWSMLDLSGIHETIWVFEDCITTITSGGIVYLLDALGVQSPCDGNSFTFRGGSISLVAGTGGAYLAYLREAIVFTHNSLTFENLSMTVDSPYFSGLRLASTATMEHQSVTWRGVVLFIPAGGTGHNVFLYEEISASADPLGLTYVVESTNVTLDSVSSSFFYLNNPLNQTVFSVVDSHFDVACSDQCLFFVANVSYSDTNISFVDSTLRMATTGGSTAFVGLFALQGTGTQQIRFEIVGSSLYSQHNAALTMIVVGTVSGTTMVDSLFLFNNSKFELLAPNLAGETGMVLQLVGATMTNSEWIVDGCHMVVNSNSANAGTDAMALSFNNGNAEYTTWFNSKLHIRDSFIRAEANGVASAVSACWLDLDASSEVVLSGVTLESDSTILAGSGCSDFDTLKVKSSAKMEFVDLSCSFVLSAVAQESLKLMSNVQEAFGTFAFKSVANLNFPTSTVLTHQWWNCVGCTIRYEDLTMKHARFIPNGAGAKFLTNSFISFINVTSENNFMLLESSMEVSGSSINVTNSNHLPTSTKPMFDIQANLLGLGAAVNLSITGSTFSEFTTVADAVIDASVPSIHLSCNYVGDTPLRWRHVTQWNVATVFVTMHSYRLHWPFDHCWTGTASQTPTFSSSTTTSTSLSSTAPLSFTKSSSATSTPTVQPSISVSPTTTPTEETLSLPESDTASAVPTATFSPTDTLEPTQTETRQIWCGGMKESNCRNLAGWCNVTGEGVCYSAVCQHIPTEGNCLKHGCRWKEGACLKPLECSEMPDPLSCQLRLSCRWDSHLQKCYVDRTVCSDYDDSFDCTRVGCSFNLQAEPSCFKPITSPTLCKTVTHSSVCSAQGCPWLDAVSTCESWEVTCESLPPSEQTCAFLPLCFYDSSSRSCQPMMGGNLSFDDAQSLIILSVIGPSQVLPADVFTLRFLGSEIPETARVLVVDGDTTTICPDSASALLLNYTSVEFYDRQQRSSVVKSTSSAEGNFSFCVRANDTHVLGPFGRVEVKLRPPELTECTTSDAYANETFQITLRGSDLDTTGRTALVPHGVACPSLHPSKYSPVTRHDQYDGSSVQTVYLIDGGTFTICYANRANIPVTCPHAIAVKSLAPWYNPELIKIHANPKLPTTDGISAVNFNLARCHTHSEIDLSFGIATHPNGMPLVFSDGVNPYLGDEVCMFAVLPIERQDTATKRALLLDVHYISLEATDELRIFVKEGNGVGGSMSMTPPPCNVYTLRTPCLAEVGCQWMSGAVGVCDVITESIVAGCPRVLEGHHLMRVLKSSSRNNVVFPVPATGIVAFFCSSTANEGGSLGFSMSYRRQETYCPNDCKDRGGTARGRCTTSLQTYTFGCVCADGFAGVDCSRRIRCKGSGPLADVLSGDHRTEVLTLSPDACAYILVADPAQGNERVPTWGLALALHNVTLSSGNCDTNYILFREGSHDGPMIRRICKNDIVVAAEAAPRLGEVLRLIRSDTTQMYIEYRGEVGDIATLEFRAISTACPGHSYRGVPTTESEICNGRGACVELDTITSKLLPDQMYVCECRSPYAATFLGKTCDTCGLGFMEDTFPVCESAIYCAANCSGHGTCIPRVGCNCQEGWYGLDCNLIDDNERLGDLQSSLVSRLPLNLKSAGNVIKSGSIDRTILSCSLTGSKAKCRNDTRTRGRSYAQQDTLVSSAVEQRRRMSTEATLQMTGTDGGLAMNTNVVDGMFPSDFIRQDNMSFAGGDLTIAGWVRASLSTRGVLFTIVDTAFFPDGRSPALEATLDAAEDRNTVKTNLQLFKTAANTHFAVVFNGPKKRVDMIVADHTRKNAVGNSEEEWMYVRHFRLGDRVTLLFDETWRHFVIKIYKKMNRLEARVFIDGYSKTSDPDYVQCVPFLPVAVENAGINASSLAAGVTTVMPGVSALWGYRFTGSMDELQWFDKSVERRSIIDIGGDDFLSVLPVQNGEAIAFIAICGVCLLVSLLPLIAWLCRRHKDRKAAEIADEKPDTVENAARYAAEDTAIEGDNRSRVSAWAEEEEEEPDTEETAARDAVNTEVISIEGDNPARRGMRVSSSVVSLGEVEGELEKTPSPQHGQGGAMRHLRDQVKTYEKFIHDVARKLQDADPTQDENVCDVLADECKAALDGGEIVPENLKVLIRLEEVVQEEQRQLSDADVKRKGRHVKGHTASRGEQGSSNSAAGKSGSAFLSSSQLLGQMTSTMGFPDVWNNSFGSLTMFLAADFLPTFGVDFVIMFAVVLAFGWLSFMTLLGVHFTEKERLPSGIIAEVRAIIDSREECLASKTTFKMKKPKTALLTQFFVIVLAVAYMPATQQSLMVLFCHPNISCLYDCYNDKAHNDLVIVAVTALVTITAMVPLFYTFEVSRKRREYHTFIVTFDADLQEMYWNTYASAVQTPFSTLWDKLQHKYIFFEVVFLLFRAIMSGLLVGLDAESLEQLAAVVVIQILFTLVVLVIMPYFSSTTNTILSFTNLHVVAVLMLACVYIISPHDGIAIAMVAITGIGCVVLVVAVAWFVKGFIDVRLRQRNMRDDQPCRDNDDDGEGRGAAAGEAEYKNNKGVVVSIPIGGRDTADNYSDGEAGGVSSMDPHHDAEL